MLARHTLRSLLRTTSSCALCIVLPFLFLAKGTWAIAQNSNESNAGKVCSGVLTDRAVQETARPYVRKSSSSEDQAIIDLLDAIYHSTLWEPVSQLRREYAESVAGPRLGIPVQNNPSGGVRVSADPPPNSPAGYAGLKSGDVIVEMDDEAVRDLPSLISLIQGRKLSNRAALARPPMKVGDPVVLKVLRQAEIKSFSLTLAEGGNTARRDHIRELVIACFPEMNETLREAAETRKRIDQERQLSEERRIAEIEDRKRLAEAQRGRQKQEEERWRQEQIRLAEVQRERQKQEEEHRRQEQATRLLPQNILSSAYNSYIAIKQCYDTRRGYLSVWIAEPEMEQAKNAVKQIEDRLKPRDLGLAESGKPNTPETLWAKTAISSRAREFIQMYERNYCQAELKALLGIHEAVLPEHHKIIKDF